MLNKFSIHVVSLHNLYIFSKYQITLYSKYLNMIEVVLFYPND